MKRWSLCLIGCLVLILAVGKPASTEPGAAAFTSTGSVEDIFNRRISLDLRDMDIVDVLKFLSLKGKFNLVIQGNIAGRVTLVLKDVSVGDALDIILKANGLAYSRVSNIVYVMTAEEYLNTYGKRFSDTTQVEIVSLKYAKPSYVLAALDNLKSNIGRIVIDEDAGSVVLIDTRESLQRMMNTLREMDIENQTHVFKLQYATAADVAAQLKTKLDAKSVGSIQADERSNQLLVTALPGRLTEVEHLIKELDLPTKAVLIEVRILSLTLNPKYDYGIDWSNPFGRNRTGGLQSANIDQSFPIASAVNTAGTLGAFTYGAQNAQLLQVEIKSLKQVVDTKIIATPRLMVTNGGEASIHIGDTIPYVTSTTTGTGDTATVSEEINFIDVGVKLKVSPIINANGYVTMKIRPEISSQTATIETPQGANIPQVNTTFVESTVIVKDGYTVVIGGLRQLTNKQSRKGLPGAMDVPLFGKLFRSESKDFLDTEIVVFLSPHVVTGSENIVDQGRDIQFDKDVVVMPHDKIRPDKSYKTNVS